jgi:hypothetical protein
MSPEEDEEQKTGEFIIDQSSQINPNEPTETPITES